MMMIPPAALQFRADAKITDVLAAGRFTISAEIIPPRNGTEQSQVLAQIQRLVGAGAQFLSVTKGAGGSLRGGSLPIAQVIKERLGVPCVAHFTCRDLTVHEVENQLMDHHYFGIRNILALRGDPPDGQPDWKPREGGYAYAWQLIEQIRDLNEGKYLERAGGPGRGSEEIERTGFCIGAAVYPDWPDPEQRIAFFERKVRAGAEYAITDMLFDPETYARFREDCDRHGLSIPMLPGTRVLKSQAQARRMMEKFRVRVPSELLNALPETDGPGAVERGVELFSRLVERLRAYGAPGIHVFVVVDATAATTGIARLRAQSVIS